jgi:hypothetical protein
MMESEDITKSAEMERRSCWSCRETKYFLSSSFSADEHIGVEGVESGTSMDFVKDDKFNSRVKSESSESLRFFPSLEAMDSIVSSITGGPRLARLKLALAISALIVDLAWSRLSVPTTKRVFTGSECFVVDDRDRISEGGSGAMPSGL